VNGEGTGAGDGQGARPVWWTTSEVAAYYRVGRETVNRWLASGRLAGRRTPGGQWRIPDSALPRDAGSGGTAPSVNDSLTERTA
jgi:excisionase family DNA binding protein